MLLNASEINSAEVNGISSLLLSADITELFTLNIDLLYFQIDKIFESITLTGTDSNSSTLQSNLIEYFNLIDSLLVELNASVSESIVYTATLLGIIKQIEEIRDRVMLVSSISDNIIFINNLIGIISTLDSNTFGINKSVSETINVLDTISSLYDVISGVIDNITFADTTSHIFLCTTSLLDSISYSHTLSNKYNILEELLESFIISVPTLSGQENYLAYLFSPETNSTTNYNNYNFTSAAIFNGKYVFGSSSGLYEYGGDNDDGTLIKVELETAAIGFGTSNLNLVPAIYLGVSNDAALYLKVRVDGKAECHYKLNKKTNNLDTRKIDLGKGLIGRYFQFELVTTANTFNLESIDFFPLELRRKI
jgi:hypothetical protein